MLPTDPSNRERDLTKVVPLLRARLEEAGCFRRTPLRQIASAAVELTVAVLLFVWAGRSPIWLAVPSFLLGSFFMTRLAWLLHDAAHNAVFDGERANRALAYVAGAVTGLFASGWRWGHNKHHGATNVRGVDGDKKERWDESIVFGSQLTASSLFFFVKFKGVWLPRIDLLIALRDGVYCYRHARAAFRRELIGVICGRLLLLSLFVVTYGGWGVALYFAFSFMAMIYMNAVFAGNHYDLESFTEEQASKLSFLELQLRTTRNYTGGAITHYFCGGLEHQIEHHLFPRMPRGQFMHAEPIVRKLCTEHGLPYHELPFWKSLGQVAKFHTASLRRTATSADTALEDVGA